MDSATSDLWIREHMTCLKLIQKGCSRKFSGHLKAALNLFQKVGDIRARKTQTTWAAKMPTWGMVTPFPRQNASSNGLLTLPGNSTLPTISSVPKLNPQAIYLRACPTPFWLLVVIPVAMMRAAFSNPENDHVPGAQGKQIPVTLAHTCLSPLNSSAHARPKHSKVIFKIAKKYFISEGRWVCDNVDCSLDKV